MRFPRQVTSLLRGDFVGTALITAFTTGFGFLSNFLLARWMGPEDFGVYAYATAWIMLLNIFSLIGLHTTVLRELAKALALSSWGQAKGLVSWSQRVVTLVSIIVGLGFWLVSYLFFGRLDQASLYALWLALTVLPFLSQVRLGSSILRSLDRVIISQLPGSIVAPGFFVVAVILAFLFFNLKPLFVVFLYVLSYLVAFAVSYGLIRANLPKKVSEAQAEVQWKTWLGLTLPFVLISGMNIINTRVDVIMLGFQRTPQDVGIYTIASRGADLVLLSLLVINIVVAPAIAKYHALKDPAELQKTVTEGARFSFLGALLLASVLAVGSSWFLALFGPAYVVGVWALLLLIAGNLVNVAAGPVVQILNMTNRATVVATGFGCGIVLNVALNLLLVPTYGINGAAVATMSSAVIWNLGLAVYVYTRLGINPTAFRFR